MSSSIEFAYPPQTVVEKGNRYSVAILLSTVFSSLVLGFILSQARRYIRVARTVRRKDISTHWSVGLLLVVVLAQMALLWVIAWTILVQADSWSSLTMLRLQASTEILTLIITLLGGALLAKAHGSKFKNLWTVGVILISTSAFIALSVFNIGRRMYRTNDSALLQVTSIATYIVANGGFTACTLYRQLEFRSTQFNFTTLGDTLLESASSSLVFALVSLVLAAVYEKQDLVASEFISLAALNLAVSALFSLNRRDGLSPFAVREYKDVHSFVALDFANPPTQGPIEPHSAMQFNPVTNSWSHLNEATWGSRLVSNSIGTPRPPKTRSAFVARTSSLGSLEEDPSANETLSPLPEAHISPTRSRH